MAEAMLRNSDTERDVDGEAKISLTATQGTHLLRCAQIQNWPKELGDIKFDVGEISGIIEDLAIMGRELKAYSPFATRRIGRKPFFGPIEWWKTDDKGNVIDVNDSEGTIRVRLSETAQNGVYWSLLASIHPSSPLIQAPLFIEEHIWPVAHELGLMRQLRKDVGTKKPRRILRDGAKEWSEEEKKVAETAKKEAEKK